MTVNFFVIYCLPKNLKEQRLLSIELIGKDDNCIMKQGTLKVKVNDAEDAVENNDCSSAGSGYYIRCSIGAVQRTARGQLRAIRKISCIKPVRKAALYQVA